MPAPYRAPRPAAPDPYAAAWEDLRRRRTLARAVLPVLLVLLGITTASRRGSIQIAAPVLLVGAVLLTLVPVLRLLAFRCPRCGDYFTSPRSARVFGFVVKPRARPGPFNERCYACGIAVGTPGSSTSRGD